MSSSDPRPFRLRMKLPTDKTPLDKYIAGILRSHKRPVDPAPYVKPEDSPERGYSHAEDSEES